MTSPMDKHEGLTLSTEDVLREAREAKRWHDENGKPYTAGVIADCIATIERLAGVAQAVPEPFGYLIEKSGINNGYYFLTAKEAEHIEDRFKYLYTPVYTSTLSSTDRASSPPPPELPAGGRDHRSAMLAIGQLTDPVQEALRRMIAEFGDEHYHTCPADNGSGPCECFAGHLLNDARKAFEEASALPASAPHAEVREAIVVGKVTGTEYEGHQVPGMPGAICHACGLKDCPCVNPDCPNRAPQSERGEVG